MSGEPVNAELPLPKSWKESVKSAVLQVISIAHLSTVAARPRVKKVSAPAADVERLQNELDLLHEELRIKDARIAAPRRPHYSPCERLAILELRAMRGWSMAQTARAFHVAPATIASWMQRTDEDGPDALLQTSQPVNKFPDFVRYLVQRFKVLCPRLGKVKIAQLLARAGLHLGVTTIARMLKQATTRPDDANQENAHSLGEDDQQSCGVVSRPRHNKKAVVTAKHPHHVWHVDLTVVPTSLGFWCAWLPFALPQCFPFCWWVAVVMDHYSRRVMGFTVFKKQPTSEQVRAFLGRTISKSKAKPKYLISEQGTQFACDGYKHWCRRRKIKPRFGAVGQYGSIAIVERFIRTLKESCTRRILVPLSRDDMRREVQLFADWYNEARPHSGLDGRTPNEVYDRKRPKNQRPHIESRKRWPRGSPCAKPQALVAGQPGDRFTIKIDFQSGRSRTASRRGDKHLPIVTLKRAA